MSPVPPDVVSLVGRFTRNRESYKHPAYNETQVRREFLDPLFKALGWDVDNEQGLAEAYKDVVHEDAIKIGGATKAPDYCFRIGGTRKFFLEAKKPAIPLKDATEPAFQLRRYAWSAKLPLSVLTDFEELAVYDCRVRPHKNDKPSQARTMYFQYTEYAERWDELAAVFSRDAVVKGSFDKYAESGRRKRGTAEVDIEFLREIEGWREAIARNFALRNKGLSVRELNFAVQRTIDRLIFLRMCEDRGIEPYGQLQALLNGTAVYGRLGEVFRRADEKYNSSLFYFAAERGREPPDELTLALKLDDGVLKEIIAGLYYPESPYEFYVLPPEILGHVYEQFLGKVIRLTRGGQAKVEEKPEVRKAAGVYYTPTYIVDYIVKHTVGKLLEGKTPKQIGPDVASAPRGRRRRLGTTGGLSTSARRRPLPHGRGSVRALRILDPACGSGSFLLGAYQYLLDWHRDWYVGQMEGIKGSRNQGIEEKSAEAQTGQSPERERRVKKQSPERKRGVSSAGAGILPADCRDRIYQGAGGQWRLTIQEKKRILLNNIYGVDIDPQAVEVTKLSLLLKVLEGESAETIGSNLRLFHERALPDLSETIKCGNSLIGPDFYEGQQLSMFDEEERLRINAFDWHAEFPQVFQQSPDRKGAGLPSPEHKRGVKDRPVAHAPGSDRAPDPDAGFDAVIGNPPYLSFSGRQAAALSVKERLYFSGRYRCAAWITSHGLFIERAVKTLAKRFTALIVPDQVGHLAGYESVRATVSRYSGLSEVRYWGEGVFAGVVTPALTFIADAAHCGQTTVHEADGRQYRVSFNGRQPWTTCAAAGLLPKLHRQAHSLGALVADPGVHTGNCSRKLILAADRATGGCVPALEGRQVARYRCDPPNKVLNLAYRAKPGEYYTIRPAARYADAPFVIRQTAAHPIVGPRRHAEYFRNSLLALHEPRDDTDVRYLVGVLNSRLIRYVYTQSVRESRQKAFPQVKIGSLRKLPIRTLDLTNKNDRARHDLLVALVQQMLDLHAQLSAAKTPAEQAALQRQIDASDRQIDQLVYGLYELTDEEIRVVEEATR